MLTRQLPHMTHSAHLLRYWFASMFNVSQTMTSSCMKRQPQQAVAPSKHSTQKRAMSPQGGEAEELRGVQWVGAAGCGAHLARGGHTARGARGTHTPGQG